MQLRASYKTLMRGIHSTSNPQSTMTQENPCWISPQISRVGRGTLLVFCPNNSEDYTMVACYRQPGCLGTFCEESGDKFIRAKLDHKGLPRAQGLLRA